MPSPSSPAAKTMPPGGTEAWPPWPWCSGAPALRFPASGVSCIYPLTPLHPSWLPAVEGSEERSRGSRSSAGSLAPLTLAC